MGRKSMDIFSSERSLIGRLFQKSILGLFLAFLALVSPFMGAAKADRIKDLGYFQGMRTNQLTGYGIVTGLAGTGDSSLQYTIAAMTALSARFGLSMPSNVSPTLQDAAAVIITADVPPFAKPGQTIDITVSALGRARSIRGGALMITPLYGADGQIYAMAQGNLEVGGLGISGRDGSNLTVNIPTAGRIPSGATVERAVDPGFASAPYLQFNLSEADLTNVQRVATAINNALGPGRAHVLDGVSVAITAPEGAEIRTALMGEIENLPVDRADARARVTINARTGTIVINGAVRISPAAITHGRLTVRVDENYGVSQPNAFGQGQTAVTPNSTITAEQTRSPMFHLQNGANLTDIVKAVNAIGATPGDLAAILEGLKQAGAMNADLIIL